MLSISGRGSATAAEKYYDHLAQNDDYYLKGEEPPGQWQGKGAEALGLSGAVSREDFAAALRGYKPGVDPDGSQEALVQNAGDKHMAGWDLTFSAPKSVSVLWALAPEESREAIAAAHDAAVSEALGFVEEHASFTRRGKAGEFQEQVKGLLISTFQHGTSREQDPQLHTHSFVHNAAQREDGSWGSVDGRHFYRWKMAAGAYYRAALAEKMQDLGFDVRRDSKSFAVVGVSEKVEQHFSKRRAQIEEVLERIGANGAQASAAVALKTRKAKTAEDRAALRERWQHEAGDLGFQWQGKDAAAEVQRLSMTDQKTMLWQLTEQESTFEERKIWEKVATEAQGAVRVSEIAGMVAAMRGDRQVVRLERREVEAQENREIAEQRFSTREILTLEQDMSDTAQRLSENKQHQVTDEQLGATLEARPTLTGEQVSALRHITRDSGDLALVRGMAGTGKSFLLDAARETWEKAGYQVQGVALQGKTAQDLQDSTGIVSQTMHSFLREIQGTATEPPMRELAANDIVVIEEAGMIGSRQMQNLLQIAERSGAKIVAVGDHQQLQPIEAGGAFKAIQNRIGAADLTGIRRQREQWMRQVVRDLALGKSAQALADLDKAGRLHIAEDAVGAKADLVKRWAESEKPLKERLMLARTNEDVMDLNALARHFLKASGHLQGGVGLANRDAMEIATGDRIRFTKNDYRLDVRNGTTATITGIGAGPHGEVLLQAETDGGKAVEFAATGQEAVEHFDYAYATTVHKSQGMTVDESHLLITQGVDREWGYVGMSRARDQAYVYLDETTMNEMTADIPPTEAMLQYAQDLSARLGVDLPEEIESKFEVCRQFLNDASGKTVESDFDQLADAARQAARSLYLSHAKDTTLDYEEVLDELEDELDEKAGNSQAASASERALVNRIADEHIHQIHEQQDARANIESREAHKMAEPEPEMEMPEDLPPVEAYQELEWEFEPD